MARLQGDVGRGEGLLDRLDPAEEADRAPEAEPLGQAAIGRHVARPGDRELGLRVTVPEPGQRLEGWPDPLEVEVVAD